MRTRLESILERRYLTAVLLLVVLIIAGCGEDGRNGVAGLIAAQGVQGPSSAQTSVTQSTLVAKIDSVTISGKPVVAFSVFDQDGSPIINLASVQFTLAKLLPGTAEDSSHWQSYINITKSPDGSGSGLDDTIEATSDSAGILLNNNDGSYTYTFENDVTQITQAVAVNYDPALTHRIGMQFVVSGQSAVNVTYDWIPEAVSDTGIVTRDIVKTGSCDSCHGVLSAHGGVSIDTKLCVTCHNAGSIEANSTNSLDFKMMIHKIHSGANLPSVKAGGKYSLWDSDKTEQDYSDVDFPQDIRHCAKCHDESDTDTPDAGNWKTTLSIEACGSCHDDVDFAKGQSGGHDGGVMVDNSKCTLCHGEGKFVGSVASSHSIVAEVAAQSFQYNILGVTNTGPGQFPVINFSVTNPMDNDSLYDIASSPAFTASSDLSQLSIDIAWNTSEYTNIDNGLNSSVALSLNALSSSTAAGDGTFTVTSSTAIPTTVTGSLTIAMEGHPAADVDADGTYSDIAAVNNVVGYYPVTDSTAVKRREVVDVNKCNACHNQLRQHDDSRNGDVSLCVMCHNPNTTDIAFRPADPTASPDGKTEESVDFKRMIHAIHGASKRTSSLVIYGEQGGVDFGKVRFPGEFKNCEACHLSDTYMPPISSDVLGSTISTGSNPADYSDDVKISPTAAACSACHDSSFATSHMTQTGGASFNTTQSDIDNGIVVEICEYCHGKGGMRDVKVVHGID